MDKDPIELYSTNHLRLNLFFKYNFYIFVIYGLFDNEPILLRRARDNKSFFYNQNSPQTSTYVDYIHFLSLVTKTTNIDVTIVNVLYLITDEIKSDLKILSASEISGIICAIWRCTFQTKSTSSSNYYICICWACHMHHHYAHSIINLFNNNIPKILCRSMIAYKYRNLLFTMHYRPTKQTKNLTGSELLKISDYPEHWPPCLRYEALYLLDYDIEMAFSVYQVLAYDCEQNIIDFLKREQSKSVSNKHKEIFGKFIEWINEQQDYR
jgi:hypothetical protein